MENDANSGILISTGSVKKIYSKNAHPRNSSDISPVSSEIDDDDVPLIRDEREDESENEDLKSKMKKRKWWFWAEIVLFFYAFCDFPNNFVSQKYSLDQITLTNWQYDLDHNITHDFDIFNSSISENSCAVNVSSDSYEFSERSQMMTSHFLMIRTSVWIIPAMVSNVIYGSLSDTFGHRWVFIPPLLSSFSFSFILCLLTFFKADIYYLLIIDVLNGIGGSFGCIILATVAYVAAQTNSKGRLLRLTLLQVFSLIASSISPPLMGELLDYLGTPITLLITSFFSGFNLIYCIIFLPNFPEPRLPPQQPRRRRRSFEGNHSTNTDSNEDDRLIDICSSVEDRKATNANVCSIIKEQFSNTIALYTRDRKWVLRGRHLEIVKPEEYDESSVHYIRTHLVPNNAVRLRVLMLGFFIICVPLFDPNVVLNLYMLNAPLCWSQSMIGIYFGFSTLVCAIGSVALTKVFELCFDHASIIIMCCVVCAASRIYIFFVQDTLMMFLGMAFLPLTNIVIPSIRTMMTLLVPASKHGSVLGSLGSVEVFCCYIASMIFNEVYAATLFISTAFVFLVSASILLLGLIIFVIFKAKYKNDQAMHFTDSLVIPV